MGKGGGIAPRDLTHLRLAFLLRVDIFYMILCSDRQLFLRPQWLCLFVVLISYTARYDKCVRGSSCQVRYFCPILKKKAEVHCVWNVMAHAQKPDFVFRRNGRVHLNRRGRHFIRPLAAEVCASAVVMLDTPCSEVVWRVLATHSIRHFPLHLPSRASPWAITFQLDSTDRLSADYQ